jgi:hypothetical protein
MRTAVGFVAVNGLLTVAGAGILVALGIVRVRVRELVAATGLAFLCGVSAVMVLAILGLVVGIPMRLPTLAALCVAVAVGGLVLARRRGAVDDEDAITAPAPAWTLRIELLIGVVLLVALVAAGVVLAYGAREASVIPVSQWDEFAMWSKKAIFLFDYSRLDPTFFAGGAYVHMHPEYPLLMPLLEAFVFKGMGTPAARPMHLEFVVVFIAFLWAVAFLVWRRRPTLAWVPVLLGIAVSPWIWDQLLTGYADLPATFLLATGVLTLGLWLEEQRPQWLILAVILMAGAANTKMEGLVASLAALLIAAAVQLVMRQRRLAIHAVLGLVGLGVAVLPWRLWTSAHDVHLYLDVGKGLHPSFLWDQRHAATGTLTFLVADLTAQERLFYVVPVALALVVLCLLLGVRRRLAVLYLGTALLQLAFLIWVNMIDTRSLSGGRSIDTVVGLAIVAVVHLGSALSAWSLERRVPASSPARARPPVREPEPVLARADATLGATRGSGS